MARRSQILGENAEFYQPVVARRGPLKAGANTPLVLLLHGRGADETDLIDLARTLPQSYEYRSLRAPVAAEGGFTWFDSRGTAQPVATSLRHSVATFRRWLDAPATGATGRPCYLLGFSAGMMMASALILEDPARFTGAVLLSGAMPLDALPECAVVDRLNGLPIFHAHGSRDGVIPTTMVTRTRTYLRERSGATLAEHTYAIGHEISRAELIDIDTWLAQEPHRAK